MGCLQGRTTATPAFVTDASEAVNGELRPSIVAGFPSGDVFIVTVAKAAE
jgi:hypothetical protein